MLTESQVQQHVRPGDIVAGDDGRDRQTILKIANEVISKCRVWEEKDMLPEHVGTVPADKQMRARVIRECKSFEHLDPQFVQSHPRLLSLLTSHQFYSRKAACEDLESMLELRDQVRRGEITDVMSRAKTLAQDLAQRASRTGESSTARTNARDRESDSAADADAPASQSVA